MTQEQTQTPVQDTEVQLNDVFTELMTKPIPA